MCSKELQDLLLATATLPKCWVDILLLVAHGQLLVDTHNSVGHCGWEKLLSTLHGSYWWPGMHTDIADCVRHCSACQQDKLPAPLKEELHWIDKGGTPFIGWSINTVGPFP